MTDRIDELHRETQRAQRIIDDLRMRREAALTKTISADEIAVILSEDARVENGELANVSYLAVKIAEAMDKRLQEALGA